ncbi:hypothetical protein E4U43_006611 [Claviceps pusilla]|uniref:Uncharacterized protein n=1 Tax=Claviceps pusilla TaxID=123648 RepID=A0A9P7NFX5_9HYPO|nr:hypothetical protein E4U43_006611 [Claviceps pusilla]
MKLQRLWLQQMFKVETGKLNQCSSCGPLRKQHRLHRFWAASGRADEISAGRDVFPSASGFVPRLTAQAEPRYWLPDAAL